MSDKNNYRERLVAFYTKHNPEKLDSVDTTLQRFVGREEELFKALAQKYPAAAGGGAAAATGGNKYRERLLNFYKKYNPDKVAQVDATLQKCAGKEEEMFKVLVQKYGPEPEGSAVALSSQPSLAPAASLSISPSSVPSNPNPASSAGNYRERLVNYYQKYNPAKVPDVDSTLSKFVGREEEMFKALVQKYGPEPAANSNNNNANTAAAAAPTPAPAATASSPTNSNNTNYKARLTAYYQKYNPEKVPQVDATLARFVGREEEMFKTLIAKYGPEPPASAGDSSTLNNNNNTLSYYERLNNFYKKYNPEKASQVEATLAKFQGREEEMFKTLVAKYGPEPSTGGNSGTASPSSPNLGATSSSTVAASPTNNANNSSSSYRERLVAFYTKYNPDKLGSVDANLSKFVGREEEMFKALVGKYGPEPAAGNTNNNNNNNGGGGGAAAASDYKARLIAFYQKYNPDKLGSVDANLSKFVGREEEMFKALVGKYGPEPAAGGGGAENNNNNNNRTRSLMENNNNNTATTSNNYRDRLIRFYQKYNPDKVGSVDANLTKFAGREEDMFKALVGKYGPEPSSTNNDGESTTTTLSNPPTQPQDANSQQQQENNNNGEENTFRARLTRFYKKYAPEKLAKTEAHLAKYAGREEDFFKALVTNYGPEPPATPASTNLGTPSQQGLQQQNQNNNNNSEPLTTKQRLTNFYQKYLPEKLNKVDDHLTKYAGREEELFRALVGKYGPEPQKSGSVTPSNTNLSNDQQQQQQPVTFKSRLTNFYKKYCPDKLSKVEDHLTKYAGREEDLMKALVGKYGAEPKVDRTPQQTSLTTTNSAATPQNQKSPAQQNLGAETSVASPTSAAAEKAVDPVQQILSQQISMLPPDEAQQLSAIAKSSALLHLIKNVSNTLGGSIGNAGAVLSEAKIRGICDDETERREIIDNVEQDEFGILSHMAQTALNKIKSAEESDQLQQKSNQLLRKMYLDMWGEYAKDRIKARRREAASLLTPYQRIAFSKSKAGYRSFQEANNLSPQTNNSFSSPNRTKPLVTNRTNPAPVPSQGMNFSSARRAASTSTSTMNTPRGFSSFNNNTTTSTRSMSNNVSRGVSPRNFGNTKSSTTSYHQHQQRSASTSSSQNAYIVAAHQNTTLNPNLSSINPTRSVGRNLSQPPSARTNTSRHELAKNRHSAETRVEKLSDGQLKALSRRLEKWGLPVPGFVQTTIKTRGISDEQQQGRKMSGTSTPRFSNKSANQQQQNNNGYGNYSAYIDPYDNNNNQNGNNNSNRNADGSSNNNSPYQEHTAALDDQVSKILDSMQQQETHDHGEDWS